MLRRRLQVARRKHIAYEAAQKDEKKRDPLGIADHDQVRKPAASRDRPRATFLRLQRRP